MEHLRDKVLLRARTLGVELSEEEESKVVRDVLRWSKRESLRNEVLETYDGSKTLWSAEFGEPFHSVSAGAVRECIEKFIKPSRILERARTKGRVRILDVGFGLGYNVALAVFLVRKEVPRAEIEVYSLDIKIPESLPLLPEPFSEVHREVLDLLPAGERKGLSIKLLLGDARERIGELVGISADAVFHDPFSPYKNPELWSVDFLKRIKLSLTEEGYWVSYTSSLPVRKSLIDLGFRVGKSKPVGRKRGGTVASLKRYVNPLPPDEDIKLRTSPFSVPFRDPDLKEEPLNILIDYRLSVLLRERELFSAGRGELPQGLP